MTKAQEIINNQLEENGAKLVAFDFDGMNTSMIVSVWGDVDEFDEDKEDTIINLLKGQFNYSKLVNEVVKHNIVNHCEIDNVYEHEFTVWS